MPYPEFHHLGFKFLIAGIGYFYLLNSKIHLEQQQRIIQLLESIPKSNTRA